MPIHESVTLTEVARVTEAVSDDPPTGDSITYRDFLPLLARTTRTCISKPPRPYNAFYTDPINRISAFVGLEVKHSLNVGASRLSLL